MASPQESFMQGHPERRKDGAVLVCAECSFMSTGRLSSKEVSSTVTVVLTENALYEFKGSSTKGKEAKRYVWTDIGAIMMSSDKDTRFIICMIDNTYRTYEAFTITTKKSIIDTIRTRCDLENIVIPCVELPELHINRVIKSSSSKRASKSNVWATLLVSGEKPEPSSEPSTAEVKPRKSNMDGDWSAGLTGGSGGTSDRIVGALGNIGPMTLIWRRLESIIQPHLSVVTDDTSAMDVVAKLKANLQSEHSPFSALGAPRDSASAIVALSAVMMDGNTCASLVKLFQQPKAAAFLGALESNLGCGDAVVRRWTALSLMLGLPIFAEVNFLSTTVGWQQAVNEYSSQVRRRENAALRLLFPPQVLEQKTTEDNDEFGGVLLVNAPLSKEEKGSEKGRFGKLRVLTKTDSNGKGLPANGQAPTGNITEARKPSRMNFNFGISQVESEDSVNLEPSDRRIRGSLALVWTSRLLDLEVSAKDEGIKKSDMQTMFQLLLGKYPDPNAGEEIVRNVEFEVETFGAAVESPEFFPSIVSGLTATRNDDVRCVGLKQINVLVMRNAPAIKAFLAISDWQSVVLSSLYNVPFRPEDRSSYQEDTYSYTMHLATTLHLAVLGSRSPASEFGPIDKLLGQTIYKIAVNSGWGDPAIHVTRSIFKGIISTLAKQATLPTCTWRHNPMMDEWEELFRLSHLLQTFLFYRPVNMSMKDIPVLVAEASIKASKGLNTGEFNDWRNRIKFQPLLNRVQNDRLLQAHRQMYAKLGLPVMTAAHRGEETGIHLDEFGLCHDRSLVETAVKLWNALGVTGTQKDDQKKSDEFMTKADKSRIMYASNVCRELMEVLRLFDVVDEKRAQVLAMVRQASLKAQTKKTNLGSPRGAKTQMSPLLATRKLAETVQVPSTLSGPIQGTQRDQVQAIAHSKATDFLEKQKKKEANVGFLTKAKTKNQATNLRSNMLQKREVAIRKLGSGSDKLKPQVAQTSTMVAASSGRSAPASNADKIQIRADEVVAPGPVTLLPMKADEEKTIFEKETMVDPSDRKTTVVRKTTVEGPGPSRRTLVRLRKTTVQTSGVIPEMETEEPAPLPPGVSLEDVAEDKIDQKSTIVSRKRSRAPVCHGCDKAIDEEVQEVSKFGHFWHGDCLVCSNCHCNILTKSEPESGSAGNILETCRYYPLPELLVCSKACRDAVLTRKGDARCPGCMDGFNANENTIFACGFSWHVDSQCFRCTSCETRFDEKTPYFEVQGWPYCQACLDTKFLHCKICSLPLLDTDKVVEALDAQYHEKCFACSVCHEPFREDNFFRGEHGELFCFNHYLQKRSPPCASCHLPLNKRSNNEPVEDPVSIAGLTFHKACFKCSKCSRKLNSDAKPGADDEPNEHGGLLFCPDCYVEEFGLRCRACKKGIRGDILHAGVGKQGETINWHPTCFVCDECRCPLLDVPFYLVTVGDDQLVPVCFDHYQKRYANRKCPGCGSFVSPGRGRVASQQDDDTGTDVNSFLKKAKDADRRVSALSTGSLIDNNPAVMYNEAMWHARCLICDQVDCGVSLYEEHAFSGSNLFKVETVGGKKYCSEHIETHLDKCFTCKRGIREIEPRANLMGWSFHDTPACFNCVKCRGAIEPGQALLKLDNGPAHQSCPSKRKTGVWKAIKGS